MKINIVNYEQGFNNGILTKMAVKLNEALLTLGEDSKVSAKPDPDADVNHHINYLPYKHENSPKSINTLQVTHIWEGYKLDALKEGLKTADMGICFSSSAPKKFEEMGCPIDKLTYVLPAHDSKPRRHRIVAILTNVYPDGCKREEMFLPLVRSLDWNEWAFRIMGSGWTDILAPLVLEGLQVDYFPEFNAQIHKQIIESADYALYFGEDEGSMGLLDAAQDGVKTIGTPQGFHLDMGLDYYFSTQEELNEIFVGLNKNRVKDWTWERHAKEHLEIWNRIKSSRLSR